MGCVNTFCQSFILYKCSSLCFITEFTREYQESEHAHVSACVSVCVRACVYACLESGWRTGCYPDVSSNMQAINPDRHMFKNHPIPHPHT